MQITLHNHKLEIPKKSAWEQSFRNLSHLIQDPDINKIDVYNLPGEKHNYRAGNSTRLVVFNNATSMGATGDKHVAMNPIIFGNEISGTITFLPHKSGENLIIADETLGAIAEYLPKTNEINIFFDLFDTHSTQRENVLGKILTKVNEFLENKYDMFSWQKTPDKPGFVKGIRDYIMQAAERKLEEHKQRVQKFEQELDDMRKRMHTTIRSLDDARRLSNVDGTFADDTSKKIIEQIELVATHPKVSNIFFINNKFTIHTPRLICYNGNKKYDVGAFKIEIDINNSRVIFNGDTPRKSYWGTNCPHPHVNERGEACLGNAQPVIAELSAQYELYPLVDYCITFLESVNTSDAAGKNIVNWDLIRDDNSVAPSTSGDDDNDDDLDDDDDDDFGNDDHSETFECANCNEEFDGDNRAYALNSDGDEVPICLECRAIHYHYDDEHEHYVHD